jgi:REP element-mobilizing transposase RayT
MRQLRILKQGVWYEIRTLINNREPLFRRYKALAIFAEVFRQTGLKFAFGIRGLRLEDDRLEFYIRPEDGLDLPAIMKRLKQVFAQRYNREDGRTGHIWGDRYWSQIVEGEPPEEEVEEETGGQGVVSANGVRPCGGKNAGDSWFSLIFPFPAAPAPG